MKHKKLVGKCRSDGNRKWIDTLSAHILKEKLFVSEHCFPFSTEFSRLNDISDNGSWLCLKD